MKLIIHLMADGLLIPVVLAAAWALWFKIPKTEKSRAYSIFVLAGMSTYLLAKLIAAVWQPDAVRPFVEKGVSAGALYLQNSGFPSDHALLCAFLTLSVFFLTKEKKLAIVMAIMTILVCAGRVLALVHTPLDVTGGVVIACLGSIVYLQYQSSAKKHFGKKRQNVVQ